MMLIAREEIILAVIWGQVLFWGVMFVLACLWHAVSETVSFTWDSYKTWKAERIRRRMLEL